MRRSSGLKLFLGFLASMHLSVSFAVPIDNIDLIKEQAKERVGNIFSEWEKEKMEMGSSKSTVSMQTKEQQQIRTLKKIIERSRLLALMLELESQTPVVAKQLTTVSLFYEMKSVNESLSQILTEMKQTNQLMQQLVSLRSNKKLTKGEWKQNE